MMKKSDLVMNILLVVFSYGIAYFGTRFGLPYVPFNLNLDVTSAALGLHAIIFLIACYILRNDPLWSYVLAGFSLLDLFLLGWFVRGDWLGLLFGFLGWLVMLIPFVAINVLKIKPKNNVRVVSNKERIHTKGPGDSVVGRFSVAGYDDEGIAGENVTDVTDLLATGKSGQRMKMTDQQIEQRKLDLEEIKERRLRDELTVDLNKDRVDRWFALFEKETITRDRLNQMLMGIGEEPLDPPEEVIQEEQARKDRTSILEVGRASTVQESKPVIVELFGKLFKKGEQP